MKIEVTIKETTWHTATIDLDDYIESYLTSDDLTDNQKVFEYIEVINTIKNDASDFLDSNRDEFCTDHEISSVKVNSAE